MHLIADTHAWRTKKITLFGDQITGKSSKYFSKFKKSDRKFRKKLKRINADFLIENTDESFGNVAEDIKGDFTERTFKRKRKSRNKSPPVADFATENFPYLDTLSTTLTYLSKFNSLANKTQPPFASLHGLSLKLLQAEKPKVLVDERNQFKNIPTKYATIPAARQKEYNKFDKTAYYHSAQISENKKHKHAKKIEAKAFTILKSHWALQNFVKTIRNLIVQPITYAEGFVLDGMRLNPVTGSNGANGTACAGEMEAFASIISNTLKRIDIAPILFNYLFHS